MEVTRLCPRLLSLLLLLPEGPAGAVLHGPAMTGHSGTERGAMIPQSHSHLKVIGAKL